MNYPQYTAYNRLGIVRDCSIHFDTDTHEFVALRQDELLDFRSKLYEEMVSHLESTYPIHPAIGKRVHCWWFDYDDNEQHDFGFVRSYPHESPNNVLVAGMSDCNSYTGPHQNLGVDDVRYATEESIKAMDDLNERLKEAQSVVRALRERRIDLFNSLKRIDEEPSNG